MSGARIADIQPLETYFQHVFMLEINVYIVF